MHSGRQRRGKTVPLVSLMSDRRLIRFGTSSWAYEGWAKQVYQRTYPANRFSKDSLAEYAAYHVNGPPLFRTVGIDHSFYRPASAAQLAHFGSQVPADFQFCSKVWEELTIPASADLPRYGAEAGKPNPHFLDSDAFRDLVLQPFVEALPERIGPFIFEFQRSGMEPTGFLDALDGFLGALPAGYPYAVEIRNPAVLSPRYREILQAHRVAPDTTRPRPCRSRRTVCPLQSHRHAPAADAPGSSHTHSGCVYPRRLAVCARQQSRGRQRAPNHSSDHRTVDGSAGLSRIAAHPHAW